MKTKKKHLSAHAIQNRVIEREQQNWGFSGVPRTRWAGRRPFLWRGTDSQKRFEKNKPIDWAEDSIKYISNEYGYRCIDFEDNDKFTTVSIGCSFTYGTGVTIEQTWPELFCNMLQKQNGESVNNYNIGWPASSSDRICRMLFTSVPELKPDLVLILFPNMHRREMYDEAGNADRISPSNDCDIEYYEKYDNYHEAKNNFLKNLMFIKTFMESKNISWIFSTWDEDMMNEMEGNENYAGRFQHFTDDWARDGAHPGVQAYTHLATLFLKKYNQLYIDKS